MHLSLGVKEKFDTDSWSPPPQKKAKLSLKKQRKISIIKANHCAEEIPEIEEAKAVPVSKDLCDNRPSAGACNEVHKNNAQEECSKMAMNTINEIQVQTDSEPEVRSSDDSPASENVPTTHGSPPIAALSNLGNTCFLNSVVYTLRFSPSFLHNLHHLVTDISDRARQGRNSSKNRDVTSGKEQSPKLGPKDTPKIQVLTESLHNLYITLHGGEQRGEMVEPIQPDSFLQALRDVNPIFEGNQQHDAHELLVCLLTSLAETCHFLNNSSHDDVSGDVQLRLPNEHIVNSTSKRTHKQKLKKNKKQPKEENMGLVNGSLSMNGDRLSELREKKSQNFIRDEFEGTMVLRTQCRECEQITERKEMFTDLCVPIGARLCDGDAEDCQPDEKGIFSSALLEMENLTGDNKYWCDNCLRYNEASRSINYEKLPRQLVFQLKRFSSSLGSMVCMSKVNDYMPTPLTLNCFCEDCRQNNSPIHHYKLHAIIMHLGQTIASGHYVAYVKATENIMDYYNCDRHKSIAHKNHDKGGLFKFFKAKSESKLSGLNPQCKSSECCSVKLNRTSLDAGVSVAEKCQSLGRNMKLRTENFDHHLANNLKYRPPSPMDTAVPEDHWLECDDDTIRVFTRKEFEDILSPKPSKGSYTPYLLFYSRFPYN